VTAAVLVEIALLHERGRVSIGISEVRAAMTASPGFRFLPLDIAQIEEFAAHTQIREPFDSSHPGSGPDFRLDAYQSRFPSCEQRPRSNNLGLTGTGSDHDKLLTTKRKDVILPIKWALGEKKGGVLFRCKEPAMTWGKIE